MQDGIKILSQDGEEVAVVYSLKRQGDRLVADGKVLGAMRMDMVFTTDEVIKVLKMALSWSVVSLVLSLPYYLTRRAFRQHAKSRR